MLDDHTGGDASFIDVDVVGLPQFGPRGSEQISGL